MFDVARRNPCAAMSRGYFKWADMINTQNKFGRTIRTVLITGIGGSGGSYLAEHMVENCPGVSVHGISRWHSATQDNLLSAISRYETD